MLSAVAPKGGAGSPQAALQACVLGATLSPPLLSGHLRITQPLVLL